MNKNIIDLKEIQNLIHCATCTIYKIKDREGFPKPIEELQNLRQRYVYDSAEVIKWLKDNGYKIYE